MSLFVGSEGLMRLIVEATVKLLPIPRHEPLTLAARFRSISDAAQSCLDISQSGHTPALLELIDAPSLRHIHRYLDMPAPDDDEMLLIAQADGADAAESIGDFGSLCEAQGGQVDLGTSPADSDDLLALRRSMHPAMESLGRVLIEDVSVPRSQLRAMFEEIRRLEDKWGLEIPTVAHAGDGNLHPNFILEGDEVPDDIWQAADEMFQTAIRLGGTLTGEHGVGSLKKRWLPDELGQDQLEIQREIKRVFDPKGLLNPGKVFPGTKP